MHENFFGQILKNWKFFSFDQSNTNRVRQKVMIKNQGIFDQSRNEINWSKIWKNQIFEKQSNFMQKLLKAWYDEYEMKCFSKTLVLNPDLPKKKIFFQSMFLKSQSLNTFCIKIKEFSILDGQNNITHNNMYKV